MLGADFINALHVDRQDKIKDHTIKSMQHGFMFERKPFADKKNFTRAFTMQCV